MKKIVIIFCIYLLTINKLYSQITVTEGGRNVNLPPGQEDLFHAHQALLAHNGDNENWVITINDVGSPYSGGYWRTIDWMCYPTGSITFIIDGTVEINGDGVAHRWIQFLQSGTGVNPNNITIELADATSSFLLTNFVGGATINIVDGAYVDISGVTITNASGIHYHNTARDCNIENCFITGNSATGIPTTAIRIEGGYHCNVRNCQIWDCTANGVVFSENCDTTIVGPGCYECNIDTVIVRDFVNFDSDGLGPRGAFTLESGTNRCNVRNCEAYNLITDDHVHAVYITHNSNNNTVNGLTTDFCSGATVAVCDGSSHNTFQNIVVADNPTTGQIGGCGAKGYFLLGYGDPIEDNHVINFSVPESHNWGNCLGNPLPHPLPCACNWNYHNNVYIPMFWNELNMRQYSVYSTNQVLDIYNSAHDIYQSTSAFHIDYGTHFDMLTRMIDNNFQISIRDRVIGGNPCYIDLPDTLYFRVDFAGYTATNEHIVQFPNDNPSLFEVSCTRVAGGEHSPAGSYISNIEIGIDNDDIKPRMIPIELISFNGAPLNLTDPVIERWIVKTGNSGNYGNEYEILGADIRLKFTLTMDPNVDYDIILYDNDWTILYDDYEDGQGITETFTSDILSMDETYYVEIYHYSGTGDYNLTIKPNDSLVPKETMLSENPRHGRKNAKKSNIKPSEFKLHKAYPNPFNPITNIGYDIPENLNVIIKIYNIIGQEVTTLVNKEQQAGKYNVTWDGKNSADFMMQSGTYICKIIAGNYTDSQKIILLK